jgi:pantoate--beta-alanine ligase
MVADLHLPLEIVGVATVRETDGLALSSRNRFLDSDQRRLAPRLYAALTTAVETLAKGEPVDDALATARLAIEAAGLAVEYLALVDGPTLRPLQTLHRPARLVVAARLGSVRLIDNVAA